jgi:hypothetical protein
VLLALVYLLLRRVVRSFTGSSNELKTRQVPGWFGKEVRHPRASDVAFDRKRHPTACSR